MIYLWMILISLAAILWLLGVNKLQDKVVTMKEKTVQLKDIPVRRFKNINVEKKMGNKMGNKFGYDWDKMVKSLSEEYYGDLITYSNWHMIDGNHRVAVLKYLYGENYEIKVKIYNYPKWSIPTLFILWIPPMVVLSPIIVPALIIRMIKNFIRW